MSRPFVSDPKPAARIVNEKARPMDAAPLEHGCPICRRVRPLTRHHVVPSGQGGDDVPENLIWACGDGTSGCHGVLTHHGRDGESGLSFADCGAALVLYLDTLPLARAYACAKKWEGWLEDYYLKPDKAASLNRQIDVLVDMRGLTLAEAEAEVMSRDPGDWTS